jgi:adenosylhomocysteine nucleosidase
MRLILVAAYSMEFTGVLERAGGADAERLPVDWARSAKLGDHRVLMAANGVGSARAAAAVDAAVEAFHPEAVVSAGFCGALDPGLDIAAVVVGEAIAAGDRRYSALPVASALRHRVGTICSIDHVARTAAEKKNLGASGAVAVEMEAAGVAARAQNHGLPFYCVRTVTDLAGENMANDFNAALRPDGHFATMHILGNCVRHPMDRLPELIRLRRRCARASRALGEFFVDCRF